MEEKYKRNTRVIMLVYVTLFFTSTLPLEIGIYQPAHAMQPQSLNQQATVSLYIFQKDTTRRYHAELSVDEATEIMNLLVQYLEMSNTAPSSKATERVQHELRDALNQHWALPEEAIWDLFSAFSIPSTPREHTVLPRFLLDRFHFYEKKEKVVKASITSTGAGILIPRALSPRPHLTAIWAVDAGKTLATNWVTRYGYNATGPHFGIAIGFIGVGFSSREPNQHRYLLVGGALLALLYGDTITPIVPS